MLFLSLLVLAAAAVGMAAANHGCATGRIRKNPWLGIRTAKTMVNDDTWKAGHAAAVQPLWVSGIAAAAITLAGLLFQNDPKTQLIMVFLACALLVTAVIYGTKLANVAAVDSLTGEKVRH